MHLTQKIAVVLMLTGHVYALNAFRDMPLTPREYDVHAVQKMKREGQFSTQPAFSDDGSYGTTSSCEPCYRRPNYLRRGYRGYRYY